jgi:hypothetical protein
VGEQAPRAQAAAHEDHADQRQLPDVEAGEGQRAGVGLVILLVVLVVVGRRGLRAGGLRLVVVGVLLLEVLAELLVVVGGLRVLLPAVAVVAVDLPWAGCPALVAVVSPYFSL